MGAVRDEPGERPAAGSLPEEPRPTDAAAFAPRSKASQTDVVDAIRSRILAETFQPGQRLVAAELSDWLGTSRSTVRTALLNLSHEGLVERFENRGARVRVVGLAEALQIAEVRLAVESVCVSRAAERISDDEIRELRDIAAQLPERAARNDVNGFPELTHQVRRTYVRIADQSVAEEMLDRLRERMARHRFRLTYRPGRARVALPYWLDLIDAICRRDPEGARQALRRHAENVKENMIALSREPADALPGPPAPA